MQPKSMAEVLGIPPEAPAEATQFGLLRKLEDGLPISALERVTHVVAPDDVTFKYRIVPKATYVRRKRAHHRLTAEESTRLARLARVWSQAVDVWGSEDAARAFLGRPHPMLEDARPIDVVVKSEFHAELVRDILGRLKYGSAA